MISKVDLSCLGEHLGLLVPAPTQVFWTNQSGGTLCAHPELEGFYIPLRAAWLPTDDPLIDRVESYSPKWVELFLERSEELNTLLCAPQTLPENLWINGRPTVLEAWVPVQVREISRPSLLDAYVLEHVRGRTGILVYNNSD